jgi:predicted permease
MCGHLKDMNRRILFINPGTVGLAVGLPLFLFSVQLPAVIGDPVKYISDLNTPLAMIIIGFYLAYFPVILNVEALDAGVSSTNPIQLFSYYFPLSSPFALPSAILLGIFSPIQSVIAVLVLAVCVVLVAILVSKVYEAIILHNGNRIKLSDMIKMATRK